MKNKKSGFTLTELLMIISLIAFMAAIAIPAAMRVAKRNAIIEEAVQKKAVFPEKNSIRAVVGVVVSSDTLTTGIVTEVQTGCTSLEVLTKDRFFDGAWEAALKAKFVYWDKDLEKFRPLKTVE